MPTSATGERGFTLIELLAVLTILALATATVLLAVPPRGGEVSKVADKLAARVALVRDDAIIKGRSTGQPLRSAVRCRPCMVAIIRSATALAGGPSARIRG